jgi:hypothetical protein
MLPFLTSLYSWKITHLALKNNHSLIWLFIIVCAVLIINDYLKYVIDQYYPYVIATCSYFKILRLIATFGYLNTYFRVRHTMIASLYLLMKLIHFAPGCHLGEVYLVQTSLVNLIKCVLIIGRSVWRHLRCSQNP